MANLFSYLLLILAGLLAIPSVTLCLEIAAGLLGPNVSVAFRRRPLACCCLSAGTQ